jgi:hypothetical protein
MDKGVLNMSKYLSSFSALISLVFFCAMPIFAQMPPEPPKPEGSILAEHKSRFTSSEEDLARTYPKSYTINPDSIRVTLLEVIEEPDMNYVKLQEQPPKDLAGTLVAIEKIVNIATKVWQIIKDNAPVVNIDTKYATAYPEGITSATQLANWSRPKSYVYGFYAENLYGSTTIDVKYKVTYTYNGTYKGKGKYLTAVTVVPEKVQVSWGYRFHMSAQVPDSTIANVGSEADPVAAMQLKLNWTMATVLKEVDGTSVYYVEGNGYYKEIASPWKTPASIEAAAPLLAERGTF